MDALADLTITMDDCLKAGHCPRGVRRWFNEQGVPFAAFMREGVSARILIDTGDGQGRQVVEHTLKRRLAELRIPAEGDIETMAEALAEARHG